MNDNVWFIKEDNKGNLWVGVDEGLCKYDGKEFTNYTKKHGLKCKDTQGILEDGDGYWISTLGYGLYFFKDNKFKQYTTDNGLPNNYIYTIVEDEQGRLWLPTNKGV